MKIKNLKDIEKLKVKGLESLYPKKMKINVGLGTCGIATGAQAVFDSIVEEIEKQGIDAVVSKTGCLGFCQKEPLVDVWQPGRPRIIYSEMDPEKARDLVIGLAQGKTRKEWALCRLEEEEFIIENKKKKYSITEKDGKDIPLYREIPFYKKQKKIALRNCGFMNPENIEEYIARGGYFTLARVLSSLKEEGVIEEIKNSGLRGRGGAGFPTGLKWKFCRDAPGDTKYIICNADEGDPGAYMDRSILEGDPHSVLEGMVIGAYAIGSHEGYIYVRNEYPLAAQSVERAIEQAEEYGLLGENILNSGFDFRIKISQGAGAFICGEETALLASIDGRIGEPRPRPPFPAERGLWDKPTNINNVKTWANVPVIIARGADWYSKMGTAKSKGTMVFSLVGKINNTGLVEVPMGIKLREMIYDIGEGIPEGKKFKAVQTGGPSGGCIPSELVDLEVDYEKLTQAGSMMGSGGMVVMDEDTCMVNVAKYFLNFTKDESCGKCTPCREGIKRMLEILDDISKGKAEERDLELLETLARVVKDASLCALGGTAPNPVLSALRFFKDEYLNHIKKKRCNAAVCQEIISSPCQHTCPIDTEAPVYISLIAKERYADALRIIKKDNPLASVLARVCHHPCEAKCQAGEGGEPIAIRNLKRFVTDYGFRNSVMLSVKPTTKNGRGKVAIIGSGPAGLTCGFYLSRKGYDVTIFEKQTVVGGMLAVGIPEYRLPREILKTDIDYVKSAGGEIRTNSALGRDFVLDDLFNQGYKAIFIATGAHKSLELNIPGEDIEGVMLGMEVLTSLNLGKKIKIGQRVGVIGGGNSAVDTARAVLRTRMSEDVTLFYRRTIAEMPAFKEEVKAALEEGVKILFLTAPKRIISENGNLKACEFIRMKLGEVDETGRRRPIPIEGSEFIVKIDTLIVAIGERPDTSSIEKEPGLEISGTGNLVVDPETFLTTKKGVFAGGDLVTGPNTVVDAVASGKIAAESIDKFLMAEEIKREYKITRPSRYIEPLELSDKELDELLSAKRPAMPHLFPEKRKSNFREVEQGLTEEQAIKEAKRCLRCDLETEDGQRFLEKVKEGSPAKQK